MRTSTITREQALELLRTYNKEAFHIQHALTVEGVMRWYAGELGYGEEKDYWGISGLLHDIDFEMYPEEHCKKAPELLEKGGVGEDMIYTVCSHGYGLCSDQEPVHEMEKVLFAADRPDLGCGTDAPVEECNGHGSVQCEEKVQGQTFRGRMFKRRNPNGS